VRVAESSTVLGVPNNPDRWRLVVKLNLPHAALEHARELRDGMFEKLNSRGAQPYVKMTPTPSEEHHEGETEFFISVHKNSRRLLTAADHFLRSKSQ